jgi:hypothetical protein
MDHTRHRGASAHGAGTRALFLVLATGVLTVGALAFWQRRLNAPAG